MSDYFVLTFVALNFGAIRGVMCSLVGRCQRLNELAAGVFKRKRGEKVDCQTATLNREGHILEGKLQFLA
jgi:hypothetical protein